VKSTILPFCAAVPAAILMGYWASSRTGAAQHAEGPVRPRFVEVPPQVSGIRWKHTNAMSPERHLPETVGPGCAFFDFNNDGWMDVFLVNSGQADFFSPRAPLKNALYRNNGDGTFTDVTDKAGVAGGRFGMGVAAGDFDGDGWQDLYVTNYGRNDLYRNNGDGTFTEVAAKAGVANEGWSTSAVWFDFDGDGRLDLFVCRYAVYNKTLTKLCWDEKLKVHAYCIPRLFQPDTSILYRSNGDGTFSNVSAASGIDKYLGKAFGVVATDVNNDGRPDLFVASDMAPNALFVNQGGGKFEDIGLESGVAYNEAGEVRSGMGVDSADIDGDGRQDLLVGNIDNQTYALYHNKGDLNFSYDAGEIARATRLMSGWGLRFFDYDNDGDPDLLCANGHPDDMVDQRVFNVRYREPLLLFENREGEFHNVSSVSGEVFTKSFAARGLAIGDYDNDGDLDAMVAVNGGQPVLLRNEGGNRNHWLGLRLRARRSNPSAAGAVIRWRAGGRWLSRYRTAGGSFLSWHDDREILGIGPFAAVESLEIRWPSGVVDRWSDVRGGRYITVEEGQSKTGATLDAPH
jgi:hypothetical protein